MQQTANYNARDKKGKQKPPIDLTTMAYGKIPPQATEVEELVLGAILIEKNAIDTVIELLKPESFYKPVHANIYTVMLNMLVKATPIDIATLADELYKRGELESIGGAYFITQLTNKVVSTANLEKHCRIIQEKHIMRQMIEIGGGMVHDGFEGTEDVFDLLEKAETGILSVGNIFLKKDFSHVLPVSASIINRIDSLRNKPAVLSGVPSGYSNLDSITNGWQPSDLIILAARPSVGKTAFALNLAANAAKKGDGVGLFSLEMSSKQLVNRLLASESGVSLEKISRATIDEFDYRELLKAQSRFEKMPLYIDDTAALNIFEFRGKARRMVSKFGVGMIIIDYLQLMSGQSKQGGTNREQEISTISRGLKAVAKELNIPIIALSQLSRAVETRRESKVPQLSDLRESGAIEQDADMVMFIYRPDYYNNKSANEHGESTAGETHIKIAKHRNGTLATVYFNALLHIQKFEVKDAPVGMGSNWKPVTKDYRDFTEGFKADEY